MNKLFKGTCPCFQKMDQNTVVSVKVNMASSMDNLAINSQLEVLRTLQLHCVQHS